MSISEAAFDATEYYKIKVRDCLSDSQEEFEVRFTDDGMLDEKLQFRPCNQLKRLEKYVEEVRRRFPGDNELDGDSLATF